MRWSIGLTVSVTLVAGSFLTAAADVEKFSTTACAKDVCFYWWPKLPSLNGWHHEEAPSAETRRNIMVPDGSDYTRANAIMFARAFYKPEATSKTVAEYMAHDRDDATSDDASVMIGKAAALKDGDGKVALTQTFAPAHEGEASFQRVAYVEEGEFILVFTISAHTEVALDERMPDFEQLISSYKAKL